MSLRGKRVVVTGGRGRLATLLAPSLVSAGAQVTLLSRAPGNGCLGLNDALAAGAFERADVVLHLAWSTVPFSAERNVGLEWREDMPLLFDILTRIAAAPADRQPHFVFFSTAGAVYGNAPGRPNREDDPRMPVGWYGHGKRAAEDLILEFGRRHELNLAILRISNPYGFPQALHKPQGIIPFLLACAQAGAPFTIWGDGTAQKDFLYHTDFAVAVVAALERRLAGVYNVAYGSSHPVNEVIAAVSVALGRSIEVTPVPAFGWDVHDSRIDTTKFRLATGWRPAVSLEQGIAAMMRDLGQGEGGNARS